MSHRRPSVFGSLFGSKSFKEVTNAAKQVSPLVKTVQAVEGIFQAGELMYNANETAGNLNEFIPKASKIVDRLEAFVPSIQIMGRSFCDTVKIFSTFNTIATTVGIGANVVLTYQGVQALHLIAAQLKEVSTALAAQTALLAQKDFPQYVYDLIRERLGQTSDDLNYEHWFFVYHPDNDWYPKFYHLLEAKPLGPAFCGYTNQIDTAFSFMIAARQYANTERDRRAKKQGRRVRPVMLHLLVPAYQPIVIAEALKIPEEIGDFTIEGRVNSNKPFVWMNLPEDQRNYVVDVGQWIPPTPGWWEFAMSKLGLAEQPLQLKEARILGQSQHPVEQLLEDTSTEQIEAENQGSLETKDALEAPDHGKDGAQRRRNATPLHQRRRKHTKK
ncbi:hypothetical protein DPSP01_006533 [Paraphaeosphaeria sporulosa]|uniref:Uncharacterized protein n=1 Tax=Paraphaeosphaeria sporulosa TaxID=1460663 RepID=A0A177CNT4_9PLEO|nr:uncharacterized protein CC84DRAFT_1239851 [Paraphaeosphaeria sporulosa]OAG08578.1 hypothetical protein CC84DRAFT_1239851 [Paraphaeosphaeria sporulosa]